MAVVPIVAAAVAGVDDLLVVRAEVTGGEIAAVAVVAVVAAVMKAAVAGEAVMAVDEIR